MSSSELLGIFSCIAVFPLFLAARAAPVGIDKDLALIFTGVNIAIGVDYIMRTLVGN